MTTATPSPNDADALGAAAWDAALARSALYEALALGFRAPTRDTVARLATPDGAAGLAAGAALVHADLPPLVLRLAADEPGVDALATSYVRLFGHTAQGDVPLFETEYGADELFLQPQQLADVTGFYAALGLAVAPEAAERPDHVGCECEFLMVLARREAVAVERGDAGALTSTLAVARLFLRDHLGRFLPALAAHLLRLDPDGFYGALGTLASRFVELECARAGVPAGPPALRLRLPVEDGVPMACGSCPLGSAEADGDGD
jgi:TorA maturation chaperone TorD